MSGPGLGFRVFVVGVLCNVFSWVTPYPWWNDALALLFVMMFCAVIKDRDVAS